MARCRGLPFIDCFLALPILPGQVSLSSHQFEKHRHPRKIFWPLTLAAGLPEPLSIAYTMFYSTFDLPGVGFVPPKQQEPKQEAKQEAKPEAK